MAEAEGRAPLSSPSGGLRGLACDRLVRFAPTNSSVEPYLESGEAVIESEIMASPHGNAFIENCARSWSDAHIRSGEDAATASAMAAETAAFYCGH